MQFANKPIIYGVDFDETLFFGYAGNEWPEVGDEPNLDLIQFLVSQRAAGHKLILVTMREGDALIPALEACKSFGLEFDAVNDNLPAMVKLWGGNNPRKIYCDRYIDDKNYLCFGIGESKETL